MSDDVPPFPNFRTQEPFLVAFTKKELVTFSKERRESFSYFAFDCNAEYGEILLCLDTTDNSLAQARKRERKMSTRRQKNNQYDAADFDLETAVYDLGNEVSGYVLPFGNNTGDFSDQGFAQVDFDDWQDWWLSLDADQRGFEHVTDSRINCLAAIFLGNVTDQLVEQRAFDCLNRSRPFYVGLGLHDGPQRVLRMLDL